MRVIIHDHMDQATDKVGQYIGKKKWNDQRK